MTDATRALIFAPSESHPLGLEISQRTGLDLAPLEERPFEEGEFKLRPLVSVRNRAVYVVQSLAGTAEMPVAQRLVRLLFLLFGLRSAQAARLIAVVPYLAYARKDRRTQPRDPVNSRYLAQLLETTSLDQLITLDVHNPAALDNSFRIPVDHLTAIPMFVHHFAERLANNAVTVASPDVGGVKRAQIFRELLQTRVGSEVELAFIEKRRAGGVVSGGTVVGNVEGRNVVVLDDLCASGGTLIRAATAMRDAGASSVSVAFTHAPLGRGLESLCAAGAIDEIVLTDSVGAHVYSSECGRNDKLKVLPVAPLLSEAIARMVNGTPIAPLLQGWPPPK